MTEYTSTTNREEHQVDLERSVGATIAKYYENGYDLTGYEEWFDEVENDNGTTLKKRVKMKFEKPNGNPDYRGIREHDD